MTDARKPMHVGVEVVHVTERGVPMVVVDDTEMTLDEARNLRQRIGDAIIDVEAIMASRRMGP